MNSCTARGALNATPRQPSRMPPGRLRLLLATLLAAAACSEAPDALFGPTASAAIGEQQFTAILRAQFVATQVVAGSDHSCALRGDGAAFCWGSNWVGQLGLGYTDRRANPYPVEIREHRFTALAAGGVHTCGLTIDGATYCWGDNRSGQVGQAGTDAVMSPTRVADVPALVALTAGWFHSCGLTNSGEMYCWGDNSFGQLGRGTDRSSAVPIYASNHKPEKVAGPLHFTSISASPSATSTCGVAAGVVYCWGESLDGVLGRQVQLQCRIIAANEYSGEPEEFSVPCSSAPVPVSTRADATTVMLERYGACAVLTTAELECWGFGMPPTLVPSARVKNAWMLWSTACGQADTGQVTCWRLRPPFNVENPFGKVGALVSLHSSGRHHCGISKAKSLVYCWGTNYDGALGDGTTIHRDFPVAVAAPLRAP